MLNKTLKNHINGEWVEANEVTDVINPATGETVVQVPLSTKEAVDQVVEAAKKAQKEWALEPAPMRAEILFEVGRIMKERKEHMAELLTMENGKVLEEARGEVQEGIDMAFYMAGEGRRLFGQTTNAELKDKFAMSVRSPIGVVGLITPWNFPIAIATWKSFPAIMAGNAVIWKPATETPIMANELMKIFIEAGLPEGVVNVVYGRGGSVGDAMVDHKDIRVISFTGSGETGSNIAAECGRQLKKVSLEMGGKNAIVVMDDADLDLAADGIVWSAFGTSGQRCTACSRVIVHEAVKDDLEKLVLEKTKELKIGNGLQDDIKVGPIINQAGMDKIKDYIKIGQDEGAKLLAGGKELTDGQYAGGLFFEPTIFTDATIDMRISQEEIFGPVVSFIPVKSFEEAIEANNSVEFGLSSSIFTRDVNQVFKAQRDLDTGIVYVNAGTTGAEIHLPFGGTKDTGNGHRDSGVQALDVYTEWKAVYVDYSGKLQRAQIDVD
ncbi:MAG TPA: aldehyde dehydrogenase family protein [Virgibacillus sp.]|nr:aldehyde dehydrogenase family protein [Virgibacillus sp.]HLR67914.1 aldehyde dehydrogenase family protein [Virgibacillus sp.]